MIVLEKSSAENPVFYDDEVDIHLSPKIGADWQLRGQQKRVVTPGQNIKYHLAGALHSGTGKSATRMEKVKVCPYLSGF